MRFSPPTIPVHHNAAHRVTAVLRGEQEKVEKRIGIGLQLIFDRWESILVAEEDPSR